MRRFRCSCGIEVPLHGGAAAHPAPRAGMTFRAAAALLAWLAVTSASAAGSTLRAGQYLWHPEIAPDGPLVMVASLDEQRLYVYRNGVAIGYSTISSGRRGHETPTGVFTILQKDRDHHSNKYDDAPMPYMERLTWDGVAMHGGTLPGYPASHGCVRLPGEFAQQLFAITRRGDTVVVASGKASPMAIVHPSVLAPVTPQGQAADLRDLGEAAYDWDESAAPPGPVSLIVSVPDRRVHVLRNGIRIGSAHLDVSEGWDFSGAVVFVRLQDAPTGVAAPAAPRWAMYRVRDGIAPPPTMDELAARLKVPDEFAARVRSALAPGTSILVVDRPAIGRFDAADRQPRPILESDPPRGAKLDASR